MPDRYSNEAADAQPPDIDEDAHDREIVAKMPPEVRQWLYGLLEPRHGFTTNEESDAALLAAMGRIMEGA